MPDWHRYTDNDLSCPDFSTIRAHRRRIANAWAVGLDIVFRSMRQLRWPTGPLLSLRRHLLMQVGSNKKRGVPVHSGFAPLVCGTKI
jgi:hypothetical protein